MSLNKFKSTQLGQDLGLNIGATAMTASTSLTLPTYLLGSLPSPVGVPGQLAYCPDGAGGFPTLVFSDGATWKRADNLAAPS